MLRVIRNKWNSYPRAMRVAYLEYWLLLASLWAMYLGTLMFLVYTMEHGAI